MRTGFWWGNLSERDHLKESEADGRIILRCIFSKWGGGMECIDLAQDRDRWWALIHAVIKFRVPYNGGNFLNG